MSEILNTDIKELNEKINKESAIIDIIMLEMNKVIVGQKNMTERLMIALLANGHVLLEGVPGLAKTLAISTLSKTIDANFRVLNRGILLGSPKLENENNLSIGRLSGIVAHHIPFYLKNNRLPTYESNSFVNISCLFLLVLKMSLIKLPKERKLGMI